jgi:uncharacterized protein (DUF779 family)
VRDVAFRISGSAPNALRFFSATEDSGSGAMKDKVTATPEALRLLAEIVADHGPVLFHQSGGCCDGSSPMCYPRNEFIIGDNDVKLGEIGGSPFYIGGAQYEVWKHTDLIIDVVPGRGGMFSLDNGREQRFLTRSTICAVPAP